MFFQTEEGTYLNIVVTSRASESKIVTVINNELKIKIKSPPVDGRANEEIISFFSKLLKIHQKDISITKGVASKHKTIFFKMVSLSRLKSLIEFHLNQ